MTRVEKNPFKKIHLFFFVFLKETGFCFFLRKTKKKHSELFYCIMQYHNFQNYSIITCYTYYGIQN